MLLRLPARPILKIQKFPLFYVDSFGKTFLILYPSLENSTTPIAIPYLKLIFVSNTLWTKISKMSHCGSTRPLLTSEQPLSNAISQVFSASKE